MIHESIVAQVDVDPPELIFTHQDFDSWLYRLSGSLLFCSIVCSFRPQETQLQCENGCSLSSSVGGNRYIVCASTFQLNFGDDDDYADGCDRNLALAASIWLYTYVWVWVCSGELDATAWISIVCASDFAVLLFSERTREKIGPWFVTFMSSRLRRRPTCAIPIWISTEYVWSKSNLWWLTSALLFDICNVKTRHTTQTPFELMHIFNAWLLIIYPSRFSIQFPIDVLTYSCVPACSSLMCVAGSLQKYAHSVSVYAINGTHLHKTQNA